MNFRDVKLLSAYLDGQLNPSDSARLELRLKTDLELAAVIDDLRAARGLLRQLPSRRAPRNFTLTPKMVGVKPPLPRAYPIFRFASAFAALLFFLSYAVNFAAPRLTSASAPVYGYGSGGGPAASQELLAATEAPVATEAPALAITEVPTATESLALAPAPTQMAITPTEIPMTAQDGARDVETPSAKSAEPESTNGTQPEVQKEAPVSYVWLTGLAVVAILSALIAYLLRLSAIRKWRRRVD